jgi:hypothetical protein
MIYDIVEQNNPKKPKKVDDVAAAKVKSVNDQIQAAKKGLNKG